MVSPTIVKLRYGVNGFPDSGTLFRAFSWIKTMPKLLIVSHAEVRQLLPMSDCIDLMERTLSALARGDFHLPLRTIIRPDGAAGVMAMMPTYKIAEPSAYGLK